MKNIETKKVIAIGIVSTICLLAVAQGVVGVINKDPEQIVNGSVMTLATSVVSFYFGYGKGQSDPSDGGDSE